jgi:S1-C subfamily serine protease
VILTYNREGKILGQGSGFFINKEGDVITNYHVLQEANRAVIRTTDGRDYPIKKVLAEDTEGDLIRVSVDISEEAVSPLILATQLPEVGERVIVIGTPLGLDKTVSDGIVSAVRAMPKFGNIIQVTAPISPGSSGSPVINMKGEVIGIATFFLVAGQNLNFAIPGERIAKLTMGQGESLPEREEGRIKGFTP